MSDSIESEKNTEKVHKRLTKKSENIVVDENKSFFYPKHSLYSKREFELLDSIYSYDEANPTQKPEPSDNNDFWTSSSEEFLIPPTSKRNKYLSRTGWFSAGVAASSIVWLIIFQLNIHYIKAKNDTQIIFQNTPKIVTDKNLDKEVTEKLEEKSIERPPTKTFLGSLFAPKEPEPIMNEITVENSDIEKEATKETIENRVEETLAQEKPATITIQKTKSKTQTASPKTHIIRNGDSLWIIARDYYGNPSPSNIKKIMDANKMKYIGTLTLGQKLIIPN